MLDDVIDALCFVTRSTTIREGVFDLGGAAVVTYRELMERTAAAGFEEALYQCAIGTPGLATAW